MWVGVEVFKHFLVVKKGKLECRFFVFFSLFCGVVWFGLFFSNRNCTKLRHFLYKSEKRASKSDLKLK